MTATIEVAGSVFSSTVWGTVGQWVSAIGTTSAFAATFYVIRRDARLRRKGQARKVAVYSVGDMRDPTVGGMVVHNLSDEPIYDVTLWSTDTCMLEHTVLLPAAVVKLTFADMTYPGNALTTQFVDNTGLVWRRDIFGRLSERGRMTSWWRQRNQ